MGDRDKELEGLHGRGGISLGEKHESALSRQVIQHLEGKAIGECTASSEASLWWELVLGSQQAQSDEGLVRLKAIIQGFSLKAVGSHRRLLSRGVA